MANELRLSAALTFTKSPAAAVSRSLSATTFNVTGSKAVSAIQAIGTAAEALGLGDVGTAGYIFAKNLDTTNYVELMTATDGVGLAKLKAGEVALLRIPANVTAIAAKANTAACNLEYTIVED